MGIVNAGQLEVYEEIPKDLLGLVEDVLLNRRPDATERLIAFAESVKQKGKEAVVEDAWRRGTVEERLSHALVKGIVDHIDADTEEARQKYGRPLLGHRRPAHGRDERRRRPVRLRQDVPAPGGEERPGHEEGGRLPPPVPRGGEAEGGPGAEGGGEGPAGHREGRRPRHRQEHRGRGAGLQRLRDPRPRGDGVGGEDPRHRGRGESGLRRPLRPHHAVAGGDDPRGGGDGPPGLHPAPAHRRGDHEQGPHRGEDRPRLPERRGARAGRVARGGRAGRAQVARAARGLQGRGPRGAGAPAQGARRGARGQAPAPHRGGAPPPGAHRVVRLRAAEAVVPRRARLRPVPAGGAGAVHRLVAVLPHLGAEGHLPAHLREPGLGRPREGAVRRRAAAAAADRGREAAHRPRGHGLLPGRRLWRRHPRLRRRVAAERDRHLPHPAPAERQAGGAGQPGPRRLRGPRRTAGSPTTSARSRSPRAGTSSRSSRSSRPTTTTTDRS